jgi:hypothetical protein
VTTAIAQFMRELEGAWEAHRDALLVRRDLTAALVPLAAEPSVVHIPAMTGAAGRGALERTRIRSLRVLWDHATLVGQLGLAAEVTGRAASGLAR